MKLEEIKSIIENSEFFKNKDSAQIINLALSLYKENRIDNTNLEADGDIDLSPKNNTMTSMRFPIKYRQWRSQHEETIQRRTNH